MRINEVGGDSGWRISGYRTRIGVAGRTKQKECRMFLVLPSSKLAEHDLIDGTVCPNSSHTLLQKAFGVYTNGGKAGTHWVQHGLHQD
jgi:hypothetical protein